MERNRLLIEVLWVIVEGVYPVTLSIKESEFHILSEVNHAEIKLPRPAIAYNVMNLLTLNKHSKE